MQKRVLPVLMTAAVVSLLSACGDANRSAGPGAVQAGEVTCAYPSDGQEPARTVDPPSGTNVAAKGVVTATLNMTAGDVTITMDRAKAPCTVNSVVSLVEQGYFDDTDCHRLTDTGIFVLQCGDPSATGTGGPGYTIPDEVDASLTYPAGTVAMANRGVKDTGGSQFFLVWDDTQLPPDYTVFGTIDQAGLDVVAGIAAQGVDAADETSPIAEAHITSVTLG